MSKKFISILLVLCMIVCAVPAATVFAADAEIKTASDAIDSIVTYEELYMRGDLDADGEITIKDSKAMKQLLLGGCPDVSRFTADLNGDGELTVKDSKQMKLLLLGTDAEYAEYTTSSKSYDSTENAAAVKILSVNGEAFFEIPVSESDAYVAVVWSGSEKTEVNALSTYDLLAHTGIDAAQVEGGTYSGFVAAVPAESRALEVKYDVDPSVDDVLYIDSVIFAPDAASAEAAAAERIAARTPSQDEFKYIEVLFNNEAAKSLITQTNHTKLRVGNGYSMDFIVDGDRGDPWALINLESYNISADEYKYVVINDLIPHTAHVSQAEGELFYCAGDIKNPTATYSTIYSHVQNEQEDEFRTTIFELTNAQFWTGKVHAIRYDYYCNCGVGDTMSLRSITFCNSYAAAQAISTHRTTVTTNTKEIFNYGLYHNGEDQLCYRFYVPFDYDGNKEYPLLMLFHGAGAEGYDATYHLTFFGKLFDRLYDPCFDAIVFIPQCIKGCRWAETPWAEGNYNIASTPESRPMKAAISVLNNFRNNYAVDKDRVSVSGYSMGGFGTWDAVGRHSELFAAAVPICGGGDPSLAASVYKDIPIKTFHGPGDTSVPYNATKGMYEAIVAAGGTKITFTPHGSGHLIWDGVFEMNDVYLWLLSQRISDRTN